MTVPAPQSNSRIMVPVRRTIWDHIKDMGAVMTAVCLLLGAGYMVLKPAIESQYCSVARAMVIESKIDDHSKAQVEAEKISARTMALAEARLAAIETNIGWLVTRAGGIPATHGGTP